MSEIILPTYYQQFYVYEHIDPKTKELLYVGKGSGQRAWMCTGGYDDARYGNRSREHMKHLKHLMSIGFLPHEWVVIIQRGMTDSEAVQFEQRKIRECHPLYNRAMGLKQCKLKKTDILAALQMRKDNKSYMTIAKHLRVSTMTVFRALNGQTKNLKGVAA